MTQLTNAQLRRLNQFVDAKDREGYYTYLASTGDKYAELALGVVREDTLSGRVANAFMAYHAQKEGLLLTKCGAKKISEDLMKADFDARSNLNGKTLGHDPIHRYHERVFEAHGLTRDAWTATAPLDVIGDHIGRPEETRSAVWHDMLYEGFDGQSKIYFVMEKFAFPDGGIFDLPDGYPTDPRATAWYRQINTIVALNADYLSDDWLNPLHRAGSPFPPCTPEELAAAQPNEISSQGGQDAIRHSGKGGVVTCLSPDVCLTPIGSSVVPIPYMITSKLNWSNKTIQNTSFGGLEAFTMASRTNKVTGDEAGRKGGVKSGVNKGWCRPQSNKTSFFVSGREVIQHDNVYEMNCSGPDGTSNTLGKIRFVEEA